MADSVYKVIELVGTSTVWEKAARTASSGRAKPPGPAVAEVITQDLVIESGKVEAYRTKLKVSFKYEGASCEKRPGAKHAIGRSTNCLGIRQVDEPPQSFDAHSDAGAAK